MGSVHLEHMSYGFGLDTFCWAKGQKMSHKPGKLYQSVEC